MFSLRDLHFVLCSRDLDVKCAQRIIGFFILITHKSTRQIQSRGIKLTGRLTDHTTLWSAASHSVTVPFSPAETNLF